MPRIPRSASRGETFHVLNRGNDRATVFHKDGDYAAFLRCLERAKAHHPVRLFAFCLMPNHFHLVAGAQYVTELTAFMQRSMTTHACRYHVHHRTSGHLWQGRFKSFPIGNDEHFLTVFRYVLQNPVRAGLVARAHLWRWSSLLHPTLIDPSPVPLPEDLHGWIGDLLAPDKLQTQRAFINRPSLLRAARVPIPQSYRQGK